MAIAIPATITGATVTGLTSPTYSTTADTPPDINAKQSIVSAVGGTQAGVTTHSVSSPFTVSAWRPKNFNVLGKPNPTTGLISNVQKNTYKVLTRKGVSVAANQPFQVALVRTELDVPAGADSYDIANLRAAISAHCGMLWALADGLAATAASGVI